jgi:hypothetical protein
MEVRREKRDIINIIEKFFHKNQAFKNKDESSKIF